MPKTTAEHGSYKKTSGAVKYFALISAVTGAAMAALFAAAAYALTKFEVEASMFETIATSIASVGTAISGYVGAKIRKKQYFLTGCAIGLGVFTVLTLVFILAARDAMTVRVLYKLLAFVAAGGMGGFIAAGSQSSSSARRHAKKA